MKDRVPTKPNRVRIVPEDGSPAFYATMTRADEPTQAGDPLNKKTLLSDEVAQMIGLDTTATPNDAVAQLFGLANQKSILTAGSYTGAGAYSTTADGSGATKVPIGFEPDFVIVTKENRDISTTAISVNTGNQTENLFWIKGLQSDLIVNNSTSINATRHYVADNDGLTMWLTGSGSARSAENQLNSAGVVYRFIAGKAGVK